MNKENKAILKALELEIMMAKSSMNTAYLPSTDWSDNSANSLTKCIIFYITTGNQAERIGNQGQYKDESISNFNYVEIKEIDSSFSFKSFFNKFIYYFFHFLFSSFFYKCFYNFFYKIRHHFFYL